jgi:hypothetical protein
MRRDDMRSDEMRHDQKQKIWCTFERFLSQKRNIEQELAEFWVNFDFG